MTAAETDLIEKAIAYRQARRRRVNVGHRYSKQHGFQGTPAGAEKSEKDLARAEKKEGDLLLILNEAIEELMEQRGLISGRQRAWIR